MKKSWIIALCASIICSFSFVGCNKEKETIQHGNLVENQLATKSPNGDGIGIKIEIPIGKKDGKGGCKPGWGFCRPKIKPADFPTIYLSVFAEPEVAGGNMIWHVDYSNTDTEENEYIRSFLKENVGKVSLSYAVAFSTEECMSFLNIEKPVGVPPQDGIISNINIENAQFDVTFSYEEITDSNKADYEKTGEE